MANLYVRATPSVDLNKNTEWFTYPGVWTIYILILFFSWIVVLSVLGCSPGTAWTILHLAHFLGWKIAYVPRVPMRLKLRFLTYILILLFSVLGCFPSTATAWTIVYLSHFIVTYQFFHWKKGTPFADDQGIYNRLTWWEQVDNGNQLTRNRKFLTVVPIILYLIASHTTDYQQPMLSFNTLAVFVLVVAKFPHMHKVRIFGINADQ